MGLKPLLPLHRNSAQANHDGVSKSGGVPAGKSRVPRVTNKWRIELVAMLAEFSGTFMFLFFAFGGTSIANTALVANKNTNPDAQTLLYISLAFSFSLMVNVWVFFRVSGGLFNPAVTLGLWLIGAISAVRAGLCFIAQMMAGICAAGVVEAILPGPLNVSTNLAPGMSVARGIFLEMFLTSMLVITIFMLAAEKHKATFLAPIGIGLALFIAEMMGVFYTGGSLNPARSFGPCAVTSNFPSYHYIYWFGPLMGTLLAYGMYKIITSVEYQTVNPGQDFDDHEAALFDPPEHPESAEQVERPNVAAAAVEEALRSASLTATSSAGRDGSPMAPGALQEARVGVPGHSTMGGMDEKRM